MKEISLTKGYVALVDDEDYNWLTEHKWHTMEHKFTNYAVHSISRSTKIYMHRAIMAVDNDKIVDHVNGDGLDNQKSNLRITTSSLNNLNKKTKGYRYDSRDQKWIARISINGKRYCIGYFDTEQEASEAYQAAKEDALS